MSLRLCVVRRLAAEPAMGGRDEESHGHRRRLLQSQGPRGVDRLVQEASGHRRAGVERRGVHLDGRRRQPYERHDYLVGQRHRRRLLRAEHSELHDQLPRAGPGRVAQGPARRGLQRTRENGRLRVRQVRLGDGSGRQQGGALAATRGAVGPERSGRRHREISMATKLDKPLKRELNVNDETYTLTIAPEGLKLVLKGKRKGYELAWKDLVSGQAALAVALNASLEQARS